MTRLKNITIEGFKSFADRVELEFGPGVAAVVGPNGSGKSNLADAVLWVLGEQSTKALRSLSMEEVIYSGGSSRTASLRCEVSLTLSNTKSSGRGMEEYVIGRQLFRDGESRYLLNKASCRLQDIQKLIDEKALSKEPYSVISQGKIDEIINSSPQDRRLLLEQVAGVYFHRKDREKSLRKLDSVEGNITRAKDILREIDRQLRPLQQQAARAKKWGNLIEELKTLQLQMAVQDLTLRKERWERNRLLLAGALERHKKSAGELEALERQLEQLVIDIEDKNKLWQEVSLIRLELSKKLEILLGKQSLLDERRQGIERLLFQGEAAQIPFPLMAENTGEDFESLVTRLENELAAKREELRTRAASLQKSELELRSLENKRERFSAESDSLINFKEQKAALLEGTSQKLLSVEERVITLDAQSKELELAKKELEAKRSEIMTDKKEKESRKKDIEQKVLAFKNEEETRLKEITEAREKIQEIDGQLTALAMVGYQGEEKPPAEAVGRLMEVLDITGDDRRLAEAALGEDLSHMVLSSARILDGENGNQYGDYIALDIASSRNGTSVNSQSGLTNCLNGNFESGVSAYLSRYFLVGTLKEAIEGAKTGPEGVYFTMEGHRVDSRGNISFKNKDLAASWEIVDRIKALKVERAELDTRLAHWMEIKEEKKGEELESSITEIDATTADLNKRLENVDRDLAVLEQKELSRKDEYTRALRDKQSLEQEKIRSEAELHNFKNKEQEIAAFFSDYEAKHQKSIEKHSQADEALQTLRNAIQELSSELAAGKEKVSMLREFMTRSLLEENKREARELLRAKWNERKASWTTMNEAIVLKAEECKTLLERLTKLAENLEKELGVSSNLLREQEKNAADTRRRLEAEQEGISRYQQEEAALQVEVDFISRSIVEEHESSLEQAVQLPLLDMEVAAAKKKIEDLRNRIAVLGQVNQTAPETLAELEERRENMSSQITDLQQARSELSKALKEIDMEMETRTTEAFELVDQVFNDHINKLFVGGSGSLRWVGEGSNLERGVEIEVAMAQKRPLRLSLLSGGEKALAALAFCLAMQTVRPSPFCLLDEVDSALDDFNIERLKSLLRNVVASQQLILITHQKKTMELADSVYGVSVKPDGSSMVVSQKFENQ